MRMSKSSWPRRLLRIGLWLGLLLGVLLIAVMLMLPYAVPWLAQQQGINLHWEDPQWRHDGLSVAQLQITLPSDDLQAKRVHVENLRVHWAWAASPIQSLQATRV